MVVTWKAFFGTQLVSYSHVQEIDRSKSIFVNYSHAIEWKIQGWIEVLRRWGRRRKQLLNDFKEERGYRKLKEETLDRTVWRTDFSRGSRPVVKQTAERWWTHRMWWFFLTLLFCSQQILHEQNEARKTSRYLFCEQQNRNAKKLGKFPIILVILEYVPVLVIF